MSFSHDQSLQTFARRLTFLLAVRLAIQFICVWFFVWGVVVLALRFFGQQNIFQLTFGLAGIFPLLLLATWLANKQKPAFTKIRASYDRVNACGGVVMAQETADMSAWLEQLPAANVPEFRWRNGRALLLLSVASLFVATALLLPERLTHLPHRALEIGPIVQQLQAEVKTLVQEKILPDKKADELQKQLSQLQSDSSSYDPAKTWEALDHIKQADADVANQAAAEALNKTEALTQAQTLAQAMQQAADNGMNAATASQAAQDLASLLDSAKLEEGILNNKIPPELLAGLNGVNGLNKEQMQKLLAALAANKDSLKSMVGDLANLKMIDAATLAKMMAAGEGGNPGALADYLAQHSGDGDDELFSWLAQHPGKGGPGGGGPEADMTWNDGASEKDLKFNEHALPPASHLSSAQLVGVSKTAPQLAGNDIATQSGALDNAAASGGSAHAQVVLPEQRAAVQSFFKRDGK